MCGSTEGYIVRNGVKYDFDLSAGYFGGSLTATDYAAGVQVISIDTRDGDLDDEIKDIDIESEYKLIQEKKSNLSANKRAKVVRKYEECNYVQTR